MEVREVGQLTDKITAMLEGLVLNTQKKSGTNKARTSTPKEEKKLVKEKSSGSMTDVSQQAVIPVSPLSVIQPSPAVKSSVLVSPSVHPPMQIDSPRDVPKRT